MKLPINFHLLETKVDEEFEDLVNKLLKFDVSNRIGCSAERGLQDVIDHPFFKEIDFSKLLQKEVAPPYVPRVKDCHIKALGKDSLGKINDAIKAHIKDEIGGKNIKERENKFKEWTRVPDENGQKIFAGWDVVSRTTLLEELKVGISLSLSTNLDVLE